MNTEEAKDKCILVVEDDSEFAELIDSVLSSQGYDVVTAYTVQEALVKINTIRPDLITLDMQLPGKSGANFYRQIMNDRAFCDIPTIVITGLTVIDRDSEGFLRSFLEVGHAQKPRAYMDKLFENQDLIDIVKKVFSEARA